MQLKAPLLLGLCLPLALARAAVLPEDRVDVLHHRYDGGGMTIEGPSVLVRKTIKEQVSVSANYYVDEVSAASIDVVTTASPYTEERTEHSFGIDYLQGKSIYSLSYTRSEENDFSARALNFSLSQDFFGDLTTLSLGYGIGEDEVRRTGDPDFQEEADRQRFRFGLTQVLTPDLVTSLTHELISDEGYLNNPYRSVRYSTGSGTSTQPERYPNTRTSEATALRGSYYLPWRASINLEYRWFDDSWGINARDWQLKFIQPFLQAWEVELRYRQYEQTAADFYSDLFPFQDAQNFLARDKELSTFDSDMIGIGIGYEFLKDRFRWLDRLSFNAHVDRYEYSYDNFRDARSSLPAGTEPLYSFDATVSRIWLTAWY
jgi:hypothetical protein